ncbi:hypothetical protein LF817_09325 [Halobacillus sp. A1]|uniref:hypothetical protein n=1 Tax=Halobacillus sp. A1 TaxID=2880262 RepID=UPI0020A663FC|nr:hypothetical protein [Halobacillus sp. A1]MCP3031549.1 hypothetical protein [Halobacillus sp. A1]
MNMVVKISSFIILMLNLSLLILDLTLNIIEMPMMVWLPSMLVFWFMLGYRDYVEEGSKVWGGIFMAVSTGSFIMLLFLRFVHFQ